MAKKKAKIQSEATEPEATTPESTEPKLETAPESEIPKTEIADPIGDVTDGEAAAPIEAVPETEIEAQDAPEPEEPAALRGPDLKPALRPSKGAKAARKPKRSSAPEESSPSTLSESAASSVDDQAETEPANEDSADREPDDSESENGPKRPRPPAKLERLQKILAAAGIASRRSAEALIEQGRVQVNGKVVTVLGTKADAGRDHIRVDGKLLQGPERLRYFVLNKPRGFVTTVKDPEGRPTVMQFFEKMKERLYPVGRLDYMSEGLLVVTNDGDLANRLTKASSGVEKTYLVKVAGQPTEAELDILRGGVAIDRGAPGSAKIHTSPARIRQVRQGDNPWYEVVLIEGRNRELRKMFEEIGHFVEKIRRTGYGPLVLDQEPGNLRELEPRELELLRKAAEGKLRTPKAKELRRRNAADAGLLPTVRPKPTSHPRPPAQPMAQPPAATERPASYRPKISGRPGRPARPYDKRPYQSDKPFRGDRGGAEGFRPAAGRTSAPNPVRSFSHSEDERPRRSGPGGQANFGSARPAGRSFDRPAYERPGAGFERPGAGSGHYGSGPSRPPSAGTGRPATGRPFTSKPKFDKPAWKKPERQEGRGRPAFERPAPPRREAPKRETRVFDEDLGPVKPPNLHIEEIKSDSPSSARPFEARPFQPRSSASRSGSGRPSAPRPYSDRPRTDRPSAPSGARFERTASPARSGATKPFRGEGGLARPFTTSSGKPRAGGARPSSKRGSFTPRPRSESASHPSGSSRPFTPRPERKSGPGWKPNPSFGGPGKPASGARSRPIPGAPADRSSSVGRKSGGFKSSGYKGKPASPKHSGSRPGGKPGGKKRG
ncbi:MAG: pseudouridine synthase [Terracidiphilus sp.]|jgi:23S rRNA pseudouridine2605 synthase